MDKSKKHLINQEALIIVLGYGLVMIGVLFIGTSIVETAGVLWPNPLGPLTQGIPAFFSKAWQTIYNFFTNILAFFSRI